MKTAAFKLGEERLTPQMLVNLASHANPSLQVTDAVWKRLERYRNIVDQVASGSAKVYGINTGFGFLADVAIDRNQLQQLQVNLIRSHACGVGAAAPAEIVRGLLILRAHTFLLGHSGISRAAVETILAFLQHDILPVVPVQGSVGASGDLAPLAHLALGLMGEGDVRVGEAPHETPAAEACARAGIIPIKPQAKEGLALINGTQFMTVVAAFAVEESYNLARAADVAAAMSLDGIRGTLAAFDERVQDVRPQPGQKTVAANVRAMFAGDDGIMSSHSACGRVQDPYSFRCVPQVHGATRDVLEFVERTVTADLNAVTDNPVVCADGTVISGGNFHGQPLAMAMDFLAIATAELGSIAERRIEKLTNPTMSGLPAFVIQEGGLNSGYMIPHVVAAALVSENKILCHPASVDSIPTSADKEDHVSMGPIAARKAREVIRNVTNILAVEVLAAAQALDLLAPLKPSKALAKVHSEVRKLSPFMNQDRSLHKDIARVAQWIASGGITKQCGVHIQ